MPVTNAPVARLPKGSFNYHDYLGYVTNPAKQKEINELTEAALKTEAARRVNAKELPMTMAERHAIIQDITHIEYRSAIIGMLSSTENQALVKAIDEAEKSAHTMEPKDLLYFAMAGRQLAYFLAIIGGDLPKTLTTGTPKNEDYAAFYAEKLGEIPKDIREKPETFTGELLRKNIPGANFNAATPWSLYQLDLKDLAKAMGFTRELETLTVNNLLDEVSLALSNPKTRASLLGFIQTLPPTPPENVATDSQKAFKANVENEISIIGNALQLHPYAKLGSRFLFTSENKLPADDKLNSAQYIALKNAVISPPAPAAAEFATALSATENAMGSDPLYNFPDADSFFNVLATKMGTLPSALKTFINDLGNNFPDDNEFVGKYVFFFNRTVALIDSIRGLGNAAQDQLLDMFNNLTNSTYTQFNTIPKEKMLSFFYAHRDSSTLLDFIRGQLPALLFEANFNTFLTQSNNALNNYKAPLKLAHALLQDPPYVALKKAAINFDNAFRNPITQTEEKIKSNKNRRIERAENPFSIALGKKIESMGLGRGLPTGSSDQEYAKTAEMIATAFPKGLLGVTPENSIAKVGSKFILPELQNILLSIKRDNTSKTELLDLINDEREVIALNANRTPPNRLNELPKDDYLIDFLWRNRHQASVQNVFESYTTRNPSDLASLNAFNKIEAVLDSNIASLEKPLQLDHHYNSIVDEPPKKVDEDNKDYKAEKEAVIKRTQRSLEFNVYEEALELNRELQATYMGMWVDIQKNTDLTEEEKKEQQKPINRMLKELSIDAAGIISVIEGTGHLIRPGQAGYPQFYSPLISLSNLFGAGIPTSYNSAYTSENGDVWKRAFMAYDPVLGGLIIRTKVQTVDGKMEDKITDFIIAGVETDIVEIRENAWKRINFLGMNDGLIRTKVGDHLLFCTGRPLGYRSLASCAQILDNPMYNERVLLFDIFLVPLLVLAVGVSIPLWIVDAICYLFCLPAAWVAGESKTEMSAAVREAPIFRISRLLTSTPHERVSAVLKSQVEQYLVEKRLSEVSSTAGRKPYTLAPHWLEFEKELAGGTATANLANKYIADSNKLFDKEVEDYAKELHTSSPAANYDDLLKQARTAVAFKKSKWSQEMIDNLDLRAFPKEAGTPKEAVTETPKKGGQYVHS